ncbi:MAG: toluene-4-monooxygenase system B family protein [Polyangia bacterium]
MSTPPPQEPLMPVYGFIQGDSMGLVVLVRPDETAHDLADRMVEAAAVRVSPRPGGRVLFAEKVLDPRVTLRSAGVGPLDRVDLVWV